VEVWRGHRCNGTRRVLSSSSCIVFEKDNKLQASTLTHRQCYVSVQVPVFVQRVPSDGVSVAAATGHQSLALSVW